MVFSANTPPLVTGFGKFGLKTCFEGWGFGKKLKFGSVLEKKLKFGSVLDFTADYGLKTRQFASCLWLRRGVLETNFSKTRHQRRGICTKQNRKKWSKSG